MQNLQWITPAKEVKKSSINVHTVISISFGFKTATFNKHKQQFQDKEHLALSVRYLIKGQTRRSLNLIFSNVERMRLFATGLQYIILKETRGLVLSTSDQFDKRYLSNMWTKYQGQEVDLEPETVKRIIQSLNIGVYPFYFEKQAQVMASPMSDKLNHSDFLAIVSVLTEHGELKEVFEKYKESGGEEFDIAADLYCNAEQVGTHGVFEYNLLEDEYCRRLLVPLSHRYELPVLLLFDQHVVLHLLED
eukprot:TRINITY_DN7027_c0_g2_i3.p1 TRINITY_DN7027_c0_g2~~TRINITY_DN7027_c0_g2_i3.p1  ORF type:complete len:248 (+),score=41.85 TRINITY_DN7027_c0_g2_i3:374-1117(+)